MHTVERCDKGTALALTSTQLKGHGLFGVRVDFAVHFIDHVGSCCGFRTPVKDHALPFRHRVLELNGLEGREPEGRLVLMDTPGLGGQCTHLIAGHPLNTHGLPQPCGIHIKLCRQNE